MNHKDSTVITPTHKQQDVSTLEIFPGYWEWESAFQEWPPEWITVEELRTRVASSIPTDGGLSRTDLKKSIPVDKAVQKRILNRNPANGKVRLATIDKRIPFKNGYVRLAWPRFTYSDSSPSSEEDSGVSVQRI